MFTFFQPVWLILLVPLAVAWFVWPLPNRALQALRAATFILVVCAVAQLAIKLPDRAGTVIVVADRSESMPGNATASQRELIDLLHQSMRARDQLGVVAFGRAAIIEQPPQHSAFGGFTGDAGGQHSDLNQALETALSLIPPDAPGRILVLSDGKWTGKDPGTAAARAGGRGVPIDFRVLARPQANDVAIQSFTAPESVLPGQAFVLSTWIRAPAAQEIQYQLRRGSTVIASGNRAIGAGLTRLMFRDRAGESTVHQYTLAIQASESDPMPENNEARALVSVQGERPLLVVSAAGANSGLYQLLRSGGVDAVIRSSGGSQWTLEELSQFSAVLLENVPASALGVTGMEILSAWVEETASGLMMTGGQKSYGPGGYFKSPLERILPISMEMRREHRKQSLAIVVALDRSGSMAAPAGAGRTKMDLANLGTAQVLDLLSPMDEIGVIAVDSSPHVIVPLNTVEVNQSQRGRILSIDSMGGGIFIYEALTAAASMITAAQAQTRHIILFADAADSEEPGRYRELLAKCQESGVTVSVIGLGTEFDVDADLLKDIASRGGGTCYFTDSPDEIPRLFAQDTFTVARSTFVDEPTSFGFTPGFSRFGSPLPEPPALGGYNLCYIRPEANLAAVTRDEYSAPVVASWQAQAGRVLCFLGEADGKFSGPFATWNGVGEFYSTLARWTAGRRQPLPEDQLLTQQVRDGICFVQLHLDPQRQADPFAALPRIRVLKGVPGMPPRREMLAFQWKNADLLEAAIPIDGRETVLNTVEIPGQQPVSLAPVCLPYSPEFAPEQPGRGQAALARIARTSGGMERLEVPRIWSDLIPRPRFIDLAPALLIAAVLLFLVEVFERRTGWIARVIGRKRAPAAAVERPESPTGSGESKVKPARPAKEFKSPDPAASPTAKDSTPADTGMDALREARERAARRTKRE